MALVLPVVVVLLLVVWWSQRPPSSPSAGTPQPNGSTTSRAAPRSATTSTSARQSTVDDGLPTVRLDALPVQARQVHAALLEGGPFRWTKDGTVYRNDNRILPRRDRGFYREFTVPTPGEDDRGARRIVVGGCGAQLPPYRSDDDADPSPVEAEPCSSTHAFYWTDDHYDSFARILW